MAKRLRKQEERLKHRQMLHTKAVQADKDDGRGFNKPGSMNRKKPASFGKGRKR